MAKKETNPLIHCEACGEDYSATYRRCPFCGSKGNREQNAAQDDDYVFEGGYVFDEVDREQTGNEKETSREQSAESGRGTASRGGKRLAGASAASRGTGSSSAGRTAAGTSASRGTGVSRGTAGQARSGGSSRGGSPVPQGRSAAPRSRAPQPKRSAFMEFWDRVGISPVRVIGFVLTLILIIAVFLIVTKLVLPAIGRGSVDTPDNEKPSQSQPTDPSPSNSSSQKPEVKDPEPTNTIPADQTAVDFNLSLTEFTISARWPNPVKLEVTLLPAGSKGTVTFTSSDPSVIGVTEDGTVWAAGKGSATITATLPGAEPKTCKVISTVAGGVPPADTDPAPSASPSASTAPSGSLKLSHTEFTMSDKYPNPVTIQVTGASGTVTWTSSNSAVASVDQNGKVSMVGDGKCTITATDSAGNSATCLVRCS